MDIALVASLVLLVVFIILLVVGIPISVAIGGSAVVTMLVILPFEKAAFVSAQRMFAGIDSFSLLALPFFILAGNIMNTGGIALKLINLAKLIGGRLPGSLAHANVVGNMLFGSISGSAIAAAAAVGGTMAPVQEKEGYEKPFSAAVNIASAPAGILIPPSGPLILYSLVSGGTSIAALFMAGYLPGIIMGGSVTVVAFIIAKRKKYPTAPKLMMNEKIRVVLESIPSLMLVVIVIGGIVIGAFTATEGAAVAVLYSLILSFCYRTIKVKDLYKIFIDSVIMTSIILFLIAASSIMSWVMAYTGIPNAISNVIMSVSDNKYVILLIINVILLCVGIFMDLTPAVLIFTPIFLPIATHLGMDPIQFGIMLIFNMGIGSMTPPVGSVLFIGCGVGNVTIEEVVKPLMPFFIVLILALLLITYVPWISLIIPKICGLM
jgi:tripartite ATP-independent transporter DctM subunit